MRINAVRAALDNDATPHEFVVGANAAALRAVVVTAIVPIPGPLARVYEVGFTVQVVACAGTVQDTDTVEV